MSDRPFKLYVIPIIGGSTHNNNGEYNDEDLYINADKLRERLVGIREREDGDDILNFAYGRICGFNEAIDEILSMIDEQMEGE